METTPKRIQRKRVKGWRMPHNTVYVGRPTRWGNPFLSAAEFREAIAIFPVPIGWVQNWRRCGGDMNMLVSMAGRVVPVLGELRGKNLACWCPLDRECHADVLLEIANA